VPGRPADTFQGPKPLPRWRVHGLGAAETSPLHGHPFPRRLHALRLPLAPHQSRVRCPACTAALVKRLVLAKNFGGRTPYKKKFWGENSLRDWHAPRTSTDTLLGSQPLQDVVCTALERLKLHHYIDTHSRAGLMHFDFLWHHVELECAAMTLNCIGISDKWL
jgi:hypothetical protein